MNASRGAVALALASTVLIILAACGGGGAAPASSPANSVGAEQRAESLTTATSAAIAGATRTVVRAAARSETSTATALSAAATRAALAAGGMSTATAVAEARAQSAATATRTAQARAAAATETARPAPTAVPPPGLNPLKAQPPDVSAAIPWSPVGAELLYLHDAPQILSDAGLLAGATAQVGIEARMWSLVDCVGQPNCNNYMQIYPNFKVNPTRPTFVYEWQTAVDKTPDLARGPLLDLFARADGDWSFVKHEPEWDDGFANYVQVFVFGRAGVQGREPEFAARELLPVYRRHLEAAAARAPRSMWFDGQVNAKYDFATSTLRGSLPSGEIDLLNSPIFQGTVPSTSGYLSLADLPETARSRANYPFGVVQSPPVVPVTTDMGGFHVPGLVLHQQQELVPRLWQGWVAQLMAGQAGSTRVPPLAVLSMDRQLSVPPIPMDTARAEAITKKLAAGSALTSRVYITVDNAETFNWGSGANSRGQQALLSAHVQKAELFVSTRQPGGQGVANEELIGSFN